MLHTAGEHQFCLNSTTFQTPEVSIFLLVLRILRGERYVVSGAKSDFPLVAPVMVSQGYSCGSASLAAWLGPT